MDKNMANRMCCDLDIRDYYTKAPVMRVDFCNTTTYGFNSDAVLPIEKAQKLSNLNLHLKVILILHFKYIHLKYILY